MLRRTFVPGITLALAFLATACGPSASGDDDDDTPGGDGGSDTCTGSETRCVGTQYQTCSGGTFQTTENCPSACDATRGGCLDCVPGTGNACNANNQVVMCNADGTFGSVVESCGSGSSCSGGMCQRGCSADGVDLIYVVDDAYRLLSFDPRLISTQPFRLIGQINCANPGTPIGGTGAATPFSMAVDREGTAWVLYNSGKIFKVSTANASCSPTNFTASQMAGSQRWDLFGMGFVTDTAGGDTEKLWIAGGSTTGTVAGSVGWIDSTSLAVNYVAPMGVTNQYSAELTGLGDATLWAFLLATTQMAYIQQVNKMTGAGVGNQLRFSLGGSGDVQAWAFAQWGGKFYVFVTTGILPPGVSNVIEVDRMSGMSRSLPSQYRIVGAGVSTCAPVVIGGPSQDESLTSSVETSTAVQ